jgi:hypothetical protein
VILDDYCRDDPAGTRGGDNARVEIKSYIESDVEDLERLDRAYEIVGKWYWKKALALL